MSDSLNRNMTDSSEAAEDIFRIACLLKSARTRGELGEILSREVQKYSLNDLQILGGKMNTEIEHLPSTYRKAMVQLRDHVFTCHHHLIVLHRSGEFARLTAPVGNRKRFEAFCNMLPSGMFAVIDTSEGTLHLKKLSFLFYYLLAAFTMFVLEEPAHPVGTRFPGGYNVEMKGSVYYCPVRDKEKEVFYSLCNFCPALQGGEHRNSSTK
ncbi:MAG: DUF2115 domain-containing protein [Methanoregula sp.]